MNRGRSCSSAKLQLINCLARSSRLTSVSSPPSLLPLYLSRSFSSSDTVKIGLEFCNISRNCGTNIRLNTHLIISVHLWGILMDSSCAHETGAQQSSSGGWLSWCLDSNVLILSRLQRGWCIQNKTECDTSLIRSGWSQFKCKNKGCRWLVKNLWLIFVGQRLEWCFRERESSVTGDVAMLGFEGWMKWSPQLCQSPSIHYVFTSTYPWSGHILGYPYFWWSEFGENRQFVTSAQEDVSLCLLANRITNKLLHCWFSTHL